MPEKKTPCCPTGECGIARRDFIKLAALTTAAALAPAVPVMAGPFDAADFARIVPPDKKLDPAWVRSLFERGTRTVYRGAAIEKIGMPVGGLCAGQLYLGGDGRLWHWDVFNQYVGTGDGNYAHPPKPDFPLEQGFAIRVVAAGKTETRALDASGFADVAFTGEYPIGFVEYRDQALPVAVSLEAFSPFIPLNTDDSSLPATVLRFTIRNSGKEAVEAELVGWLENAVCLYSGRSGGGTRANVIARRPGVLALECSAREPKTEAGPARSDVVFEEFQKTTYEGWEATGTAFGSGPILKASVPGYQGDVGGKGPRVVNSHASAPGGTVEEKDSATGTLTSRPFTIERSYVRFLIGGGNHPGKTCVDLLIDGKVVRSATGRDSNAMGPDGFDVRELQGKTARLRIVDDWTGAWGNVGVAEIVFSDQPPGPSVPFEERPDYGTMALALLGPVASDRGAAALPDGPAPDAAFAAGEAKADRPFGQKLRGALGRKVKLAPGRSARVDFVLTWRFPNLRLKDGGRFYANQFDTAGAVADYVASHFDRLARETRLWHDVWYDSSLPYWFLDRTFLNTSILATSTSYRFRNGRFYGWEGVGCCEGTCTHVWHYAHAVARLFPDLERDLRTRTDFGTAMDPSTGVINHRGEGAGLAVDGQAGCILRAYREHQMSADPAFLKSLWPKVKLAMQCLMRMDDGQGILEGGQHNTLDAPWFGKVAWLSSLYAAAARACEEMAREVGDDAFAREARAVYERGSRSIDRELFNGEYFVQKADPAHAKSVGSYDGCEIDQVFGQSWAHQVALGRVLPEAHTRAALASLWKYNFTPDVGPWRNANKPGRWYAMAGEGGLIMCTWPKGDSARVQQGFDFYFNECMTGFEYQVAGHMLWEGMLTEGLAITRAIHDRYHASRRNPWNEVECGDHYARAMASYGVFLAACGYEHHGPNGHLGFAPRLKPEDFRAAFTTAEGWGAYSQKRAGKAQRHTVALSYGRLRLKTLALELPAGAAPARVTATLNGKPLAATHRQTGRRLEVTLAAEARLKAGDRLEVVAG